MKKVALPHEAEGGVLQQEKKKSSFFVCAKNYSERIVIVKMHGSWINVLIIETG